MCLKAVHSHRRDKLLCVVRETQKGHNPMMAGMRKHDSLNDSLLGATWQLWAWTELMMDRAQSLW